MASTTSTQFALTPLNDRVVVRPLHPCGQCPACAAGNSHICPNLKFLGLDSDGAMQEAWDPDRDAEASKSVRYEVLKRRWAMSDPRSVVTHAKHLLTEPSAIGMYVVDSQSSYEN